MDHGRGGEPNTETTDGPQTIEVGWFAKHALPPNEDAALGRVEGCLPPAGGAVRACLSHPSLGLQVPPEQPSLSWSQWILGPMLKRRRFDGTFSYGLV